MVKKLFDIALAAVCQTSYETNWDFFSAFNNDCKQRMLEFFTSHDLITSQQCKRLFSSPQFGANLTEINFYLSDQLTDSVLAALVLSPAKFLRRIAIVECDNVTDDGIQIVTIGQSQLRMLELRNLRAITSEALKCIQAPHLAAVDVSGCAKITSDGIFYLVNQNPNIRCLYLNHCRGLDDQALYDIAHCIGEKLHILELDFLPNMVDPARSLHKLSQRCPNLNQLSLCNFFESTESSSSDENDEETEPPARIEGAALDYVDLCGNYFTILPELPPTVRTIRLSATGGEDMPDLIAKLAELPALVNIHLELIAPGKDWRSIENINEFLCCIIPKFGNIITRLHVHVQELRDDALCLITRNLPYLVHLSLDVRHTNLTYLQRYFCGGHASPGARLQSLRLSKLRVSYRLLFAIGRCAASLTDLETTHMNAVDDRFLRLLADNCKELRAVNFNGCKWVTDKGLAALARNGSLKEVRIRGTGCSDTSIYNLAQFCPELEWIAHADFSGRPKFSDEALTCLRNSCVQRVIC
uniref:F-box domain-containing protein n=1 Tax=Panagrellus redivivus TaxID=6233 RepID=A0A7E4UYY7_PANRE